MFELSVVNAGMAFFAGFPAVASVLLLLWATYGVSCVLWRVDDREGDAPRNPVFNWVMTKNGYIYQNSKYRKYNTVRERRSTGVYTYEVDAGTWDTGDLAGTAAVITFFVPSAVYWSVVAPFVPSTVAVLVLVAFLARSGRRVQKMLKKHVEDKTVHRENGE